jgi:hypothetical protein
MSNEKNHSHVKFDNERALFSHTSNFKVSTFVPNSNEALFQNEVPEMDDETHMDTNSSHVAFASIILEHQFDNTCHIINYHSFHRLPTCYSGIYCHDEKDYVYEIVNFHSSIYSNVRHVETSVETNWNAFRKKERNPL